jgi:hypothetical protein
MRRLSVVMAAAALDTYMHRLIVERAYWHRELPKRLARLDVSFEQLLAQADEAGAAARAEPTNSRPRVAVKRQLRDRLLRDTFQTYDNVTNALSMSGVRRKWEAIGNEMTPTMAPIAIKERLDAIVRRRNQIVHEGDYERLERPRDGRLVPMTTSSAAADIDFLAQLVDAIHTTIT